MSYKLRCDACGAESEAEMDVYSAHINWTHIEVSRGPMKRDRHIADICLQCEPKLRELLLFAQLPSP